VANDDSATTDEDTSAIIDVLTNDTDPDGDSLTVTNLIQPANGTAFINGDDTVTYTPNLNFNGTDTFTYTISDGKDGTDMANVDVTVEPVNDAPVANGDSATTLEDIPVTIDVLANDSDVDGDALIVVSATQGANGSVVINADETVTYTPNADFTGTDTFEYTASDGNGETDTAMVTITVSPFNNSPVALDDSYSVDEDDTLIVDAPGVLANDSDLDGDALTAILVDDVSNGTLSLNSNGSFIYMPDENFSGPDNFTYKANDGTANSNVATVSINVGSINDAPVANNDFYSMDQDTTLTVSAPGVLGNDTDADNDPLTASLVTSVSDGSLTLNSDGSFTYTPDLGFYGTDSFTYTANDGMVDSGVATVFITVNQAAAMEVTITKHAVKTRWDKRNGIGKVEAQIAFTVDSGSSGGVILDEVTDGAGLWSLEKPQVEVKINGTRYKWDSTLVGGSVTLDFGAHSISLSSGDTVQIKMKLVNDEKVGHSLTCNIYADGLLLADPDTVNWQW
jgi:VCBS repeat-containing protein